MLLTVCVPNKIQILRELRAGRLLKQCYLMIEQIQSV